MTMQVRPVTMVDAVRPQVTGLVWDAFLVLTFGTLMGIFAQISVPLPFTPVPITGQTFGVLLTGALLGSRRGAGAMLVYLAEGVSGLPVFALGQAGWVAILGPAGGYLLSYPLAAFVVGFLSERGWDRSFRWAVLAMLAGEIVVYSIALPWLAHFVGFGQAVPLGLLPFIPGDALKLILAAMLLPSGWLLLKMAPGDRL